jgi:hypothetical protein
MEETHGWWETLLHLPEGLVGEGKLMIEGMTELVSYAFSDVVSLHKEGLEALGLGEYDTEFKIPQVGAALLGIGQKSALLEDYKDRYGSVHGVREGLYDQPLSYLLDLVGLGFIASKGLTVGAKTGLIANNEKLLRIAGKVNGIDLEGVTSLKTMREMILKGRPTFKAMDLGGGTDVSYGLGRTKGQVGLVPKHTGVIEMPLSRNWVVRAPQKALFNALSWSVDAEKVSLYVKALDEVGETSKFMRAGFNREWAEKLNIPIAKPLAGAAARNQVANKILGLVSSKAQKTKDRELAILMDDILSTMQDDPAGAVSLVEGLGDLSQKPPITGIEDFLPDIPEMEVLPLASPAERIGRLPGSDPNLAPQFSRYLGERELIEALNSRWERSNVNPRYKVLPAKEASDLRYDVIVSEMTAGEVSSISRELADLVDADILGARNTLRTEALDFDGYEVALKLRKDGRVLHLNIADPLLFDSQIAAREVLSKTGWLAQKIDDLSMSIAHGLTDDVDTEIARLKILNTEKDAINYYLRLLWTPNRRFMNAKSLGIPYHGDLFAMDRIVPWEWRNGMRQWIEHDFNGGFEQWFDKQRVLEGPFTVAARRAYAPLRVQQFANVIGEFSKEIDAAYSSLVGSSSTAANNTQKLGAHLKIWLSSAGYSSEKVAKIISGKPWLRDSAKAKQVLITRFIREMHEEMVVRGTHAGFEWGLMDKARMIEGKVTPHYFPHIRGSRMKPSDYVWRGGTLQSINTGKPVFSKSWTGTLMEAGLYSKNPAEVYGRVAKVMNQHEEVIDFASQVARQNGRIVERIEAPIWEAGLMGEGEVLFNPEQLRLALRQSSDNFLEAFTHMDQNNMNWSQAMDQVMDTMKQNILKKGISAFQEGEVYAIPRNVAGKIAQQSKLAAGWKMRMFYDGTMNLWKGAVLGLSPRWVINNLMGNTFMQLVRNPTALLRSKGQYSPKEEFFFRIALGDDLAGVVHQGFWEDIPRRTSFGEGEGTKFGEFATAALEGTVPPGASPIVRAAGQSQRVTKHIRTFARKVRHKNQLIEHAYRRGSFLSLAEKEMLSVGEAGKFLDKWVDDYEILSKIARGGLTPEQFNRVVDGVNATLGNYTALSPAERQIVRRIFIPFYPFYRHSVKFLLRMPIEHPLKSATFLMIDKLSEEINGDIPDWLKGSIKVGELGGQDTWWRIQNFNPLQALAEDGGWMATFNPIGKILLERSQGVSSFTGKAFPLDPSKNVRTFGGAGYDIDRGPNGEILGVTPSEGHILPSLINHIAGQFPQLGLLGSMIGALPGMEGSGPLQPYPKEPGLSLASYLGVPVTHFDLDSWRYQELQREIEALQAALKANAIGPEGKGLF